MRARPDDSFRISQERKEENDRLKTDYAKLMKRYNELLEEMSKIKEKE